MSECTSSHRMAPVDSAIVFIFFFFHSLSLPIAVFASLIPVHCFTKGHNLSNHYKLY